MATMTTTAMKAMIKAYSTRPWPSVSSLPYRPRSASTNCNMVSSNSCHIRPVSADPQQPDPLTRAQRRDETKVQRNPLAVYYTQYAGCQLAEQSPVRPTTGGVVGLAT